MNPSSSENRRAIVVTGPVGAGKTTIMATLTELLEEHGIPNGGVDMDHFRWFYPKSTEDPFGGEIGRKNLAFVAANYRSIGISTLVLADVVEHENSRLELQTVLPDYSVVVVRLKVPMHLIEERLKVRESTENLQWYLNRAPELEQIMEDASVGDFVIEVGQRNPREVAEDIARQLQLIDPS